MAVAIFDLDRTLTKYATYTPFLIFAAFHRAPWRLLLLPLWLVAMLGYVAGIFSRKTLKEIGFYLLIGRVIGADTLQTLANRFANVMISRNLLADAVAQVRAERAAGARLILATASPDFYAKSIAERLGFDQVIATQHQRTTSAQISHKIAGENCYGAAKLGLVRTALADAKVAEIRFYSDSASDAPLLDWVGSAYAVNPDRALRRLAQQNGWSVLIFA